MRRHFVPDDMQGRFFRNQQGRAEPMRLGLGDWIWRKWRSRRVAQDRVCEIMSKISGLASSRMAIIMIDDSRAAVPPRQNRHYRKIRPTLSNQGSTIRTH